MPDIVQMDYLYISTYSSNDSLADMQPFIDDGTLDVTNIEPAVLNAGRIDGKLTGLVLSTSLLAMGYNPEVFEEAGVAAPSFDWNWDDYAADMKQIKETTGKFGSATNPVKDTNIFRYWVRQHGYSFLQMIINPLAIAMI